MGTHPAPVFHIFMQRLIPSPATTDAIPLQSCKRSRVRITCHWRVRSFSILGDLCFLSHMCKALRSQALPASSLKMEPLQWYSQSKLYFGLARGTRQFSSWLSVKVLLSLLFPSKNVFTKKKKKEHSPLSNCCSLPRANNPYSKCISSEHSSQNITKLNMFKMAAVSLKRYIMTEVISQNTNFLLSLILS